MADIDSGVHAAHDAYIKAINSNNLDNFLASITDDIVYLPPNAAAIVGKGEVGSWVQGYFEAFHTQWVKTTIEFVVRGDLGYEWYTYQVTDTPRDGGDATTDSGNGINIYRCGADATWRVSRHVWATDRPAS